VLALIDRKPGITGAVLAKELGIQSSQVYNLTGKLVKEKVIRKRGATYEMMPGAPATKIVATKKRAAATAVD
jgi:DNA-binding IclR family transcriptional regulator